jgi:hypothetical protein
MGKQIKNHKTYGRTKLDEELKRAIKIAVFFNLIEYEDLILKCSETYLNAPEFIRRAALSKRIERKKSIYDAEAINELRAIGQNINRISRDLARARKSDLQVDFEMLEKFLADTFSVIHELKMQLIEAK